MSSSALNIALTGLAAARVGLNTTSHNIANAATPGFNRQRAEFGPQDPELSGGGFVGRGVQTESVQRVFSAELERQVQVAQARTSYFDAYTAQVSQLNSLLADPSSGLSPALQDLFRAVQDVSGSPASVPSRQALLSSASALAARFGALDQRFEELRAGINIELRSIADRINGHAREIADLNERIATLSASVSVVPNDLLDRRDHAVTELNRLISTTVNRQNDGSYNVVIGTGQPIVVGGTVSPLTALASRDDPRQLELSYVTNGNAIRIPESNLQGGQLGGLLAFRSQTLIPTQNALGRVAIALTSDFNDQQRLGQDLNGAPGVPFFGTIAPAVTPRAGVTQNPGAAIADANALTTSNYRLAFDGTNYTLTRLADNASTSLGTLATPVTVDGVTYSAPPGPPAAGDSWLIEPTRFAAREISVALVDTAQIAAAAPVRAQALLANTGSGILTAPSVNGPPPVHPALGNHVTITFNSPPTSFDVVDTTAAVTLASGVAYTPGMTISYNGWSAELRGAPAPGDAFAVLANAGGVADNRNMLRLAALQTANRMLGDTASYQGAYSQIVSGVGNTAREVQVSGAAQAELLAESRRAQQSLSGVNLDEEAANLIRFQQAFQASSKVIAVAARLFESVLEISR